MMIKIRNVLVCLLGGIVFLWGSAPILIGKFLSGTFLSILFAAFLFASVYMSKVLKKASNKKWKIFTYLFWTASYIGIIVCSIVSARMIWGVVYYEEGTANGETVIVLGCLINEDQPSQMLQQRLDRAAVILCDSPNSACIVSGGQGDNEQYTEALVMKEYLIQQGIAAERIYMEDASHNTQQNIAFSKTILTHNNLNERVILVTSEYHLYRAQIYARLMDLDFVSAGSGTRWELLMSSWLREIPAILKVYVLG